MADNDALLTALLQSLGAGAPERVRQGFTRRTALSPEQEAQYRQAMILNGLGKYIDDPTYDNRAAWLSGRLPNRQQNPTQHGSSQFKGLGDDRLFLPIGPNGQMLDTRTAKPSADPNVWTGPTPDPRLLALWRLVSGTMNK